MARVSKLPRTNKTRHWPKFSIFPTYPATLRLYRRCRFAAPHAHPSIPPRHRQVAAAQIGTVASQAGFVGDRLAWVACQHGMPHEPRTAPKRYRIRRAWTYAERLSYNSQLTYAARLARGIQSGMATQPASPFVAGRLQWAATELTWSSHAVPCRSSIPFSRTATTLSTRLPPNWTRVHTARRVKGHQGHCCSPHTESRQVPA